MKSVAGQWEFQDPKMKVLYHIRPYFVGIFPYIGRYLQFRIPKFPLGWLVVWNMNLMTFHIVGLEIPTDELIFFRGVETTNQVVTSVGPNFGPQAALLFIVLFYFQSVQSTNRRMPYL